MKTTKEDILKTLKNIKSKYQKRRNKDSSRGKGKMYLLKKLFETLKINNKRKVENIDVFQENKKKDISKILAYAGIGKTKLDICDDINIKEIKLNDKQYIDKRFGV